MPIEFKHTTEATSLSLRGQFLAWTSLEAQASKTKGWHGNPFERTRVSSALGHPSSFPAPPPLSPPAHPPTVLRTSTPPVVGPPAISPCLKFLASEQSAPLSLAKVFISAWSRTIVLQSLG